MARKFDDVVSRVRTRIEKGQIVLDERVRSGRKRQMSVGPYKSAAGPREYAFCVLPALPGGTDCRISRSADKAAREFVRTIGTQNAEDALVRASRKHG
jgi:hypothetical protein